MPQKSAAQIRHEFQDFFEKKGHLKVPGAPVVPQNDPTLLFINAGMNQFKPIFLGEQSGYEKDGKTWKRAVDSQRCIRVSGKHNDLEEVGYDTYHHTLFEMLGNWSFGDYFKREAIRWAWELLVDVWELEPERLYATVFEGDKKDSLPVDDESIELWKSETSIDPEHILKFDKTDNFWEMGDTGPCGPCSEIHVDLRPDEERAKKDGAELVNMDDPRVMEIWNLVFIQFNRKSDGTLEKLPEQHVDTGMGFERMCAVLQEKKSNYDTDLFTPLLNKIGELANVNYGDNEQTDIAMRVIADHIRAVSFSIADGASPGNEGRGFVIRRILRRAIRYGWDKLNLKEPFFYKLVPALADQFEDVFPVLVQQKDYVSNVIRSEEKSFLNTLGQGIELFEKLTEGRNEISGEDAFKLHDTYGFPIDLTQLMARERGVDVDVDDFNKRMQEQKERARAAGKFKVDQSSQSKWIPVNEVDSFDFVGYDSLSTESRIKAMRSDGDGRNAIILDKTPFYAESGGQVADTGVVSNGDEHLRVLNVQKSQDGFIHFVDKLPNQPEGEWQTMVDAKRRGEIRKHHSATHLVHAALKKVLGNHVAQKGSLVDESHLRFDFSHFEQVTPKELSRIEEIVNERIQQNIVRQEERNVPIDEAKERGATMLFGEKYGDEVRIIAFDPDYSMELCGGTHVDATGEIGYFRLMGESSAAAGIRRIEAKVGKGVDDYLRAENELINQIRSEMGQSENPVRDIRQLIEERKNLEKEVERLRHQQSTSTLDNLISNSIEFAGIKLVAGEIPGAEMDLLKQLGYESLEKSKEGTITILGARNNEEGKVYIAAAVTDDLIKEKGLKAGALVGELGKMLGGGGGGQPNLATAGGRKPEMLQEVLDQLEDIVKKHLEQ